MPMSRNQFQTSSLVTIDVIEEIKFFCIVCHKSLKNCTEKKVVIIDIVFFPLKEEIFCCPPFRPKSFKNCKSVR